MEYKILQVVTSYKSVYTLLLDKMQELEKFGYDIEFMSGYPEGIHSTDVTTKVIEGGFKHHLVPMSRAIELNKDFKSINIVYKFMKKNRYNVVHTRTAKAGFIGRIAAKLAKAPVIIHTSHGLPFFKGQNKIHYNIYKQLELLASKFSDGYFSQNKEDLNAINEMVSPKLLTGYEGNGINEKKLAKQIIDNNIKKKIRSELGLKKEDFVFLTGARLEAVKNHLMILKSLVNVSSGNIKILFAGDGPLYNHLRQKTTDLGLDEKVYFLGYRKDILNLIQISDAVLLTSEKEGIPRIVMESMFFEKPILATNVLGTRELVKSGYNGELVEYNDYYSLAEKMDKWADNRFEYQLMNYGICGKDNILDYYTETKVAERINKHYQMLL